MGGFLPCSLRSWKSLFRSQRVRIYEPWQATAAFDLGGRAPGSCDSRSGGVADLVSVGSAANRKSLRLVLPVVPAGWVRPLFGCRRFVHRCKRLRAGAARCSIISHLPAVPTLVA